MKSNRLLNRNTIKLAVLMLTAAGPTVNALAAKPKPSTAFTEQQLQVYLEQIIFPSATFENTPLRDVVRSIVTTSRKFDPQRRGVDMLLQQPPQSVAQGPTRTRVAGQQLSCTVTLRTERISLRMLLDELCRQCDFEWTVADITGEVAEGKKKRTVHNIVVHLTPRNLYETPSVNSIAP